MESATKRRLSESQIKAAVTRAFGDGVGVLDSCEIHDGMFNAVYRLRLSTGDLVILKSSPPADVPLLTYERDIMRTEAAFYELATTASDVPVPLVLATDFSRKHLDGDLLFLSYLDGTPWCRMHDEIDDATARQLRADLGATVARLHQVKGTTFGYFQPGAARSNSWRAAFLGMLDHVLSDARRFDVTLPVDATDILAAVLRHAGCLDAVAVPSLVHFDLWEGNIFLRRRDDRYEIAGLIDGERAIWADPLAEFVSISLFADIADDRDFRAGYETASGASFDITPDVSSRIAMYKAYLDLVMIVETAPRGYTPEQHGEVLQLAIDDLRASLARL